MLSLRACPYIFSSPRSAAPTLWPPANLRLQATSPVERAPASPVPCVYLHHALPMRAAHRSGCILSEGLGTDEQMDT